MQQLTILRRSPCNVKPKRAKLLLCFLRVRIHPLYTSRLTRIIYVILCYGRRDDPNLCAWDTPRRPWRPRISFHVFVCWCVPWLLGGGRYPTHIYILGPLIFSVLDGKQRIARIMEATHEGCPSSSCRHVSMKLASCQIQA